MDDLDFPKFDFRLEKIDDDKQLIWDIVRRKMVVLTPEEWVRQHMVHYLILRGYPKPLIKVETGIKYGRMAKRTDILIYDRAGRPFLLLECKAASVNLSNETMHQCSTYNAIIKAPFIAVTNGLKHFFCAIDFEKKQYQFLMDLPAFGASAEQFF